MNIKTQRDVLSSFFATLRPIKCTNSRALWLGHSSCFLGINVSRWNSYSCFVAELPVSLGGIRNEASGDNPIPKLVNTIF